MSLWQKLFGAKPVAPLGVVTYGGYEPVDKVAQGRLSTLYRGRHTETGEIAAIKVLSDYACRVADKLTRKLKKDWEGTRAMRLEHRNVVRTVGCGKDNGRYYILMEFLPGGNLSDLLRRDAPSIEGKKLEIMQQAARGLDYVHTQGVIHRDVCPKNVMLSAYGVAKLIDFGVAADKGDKIRNTGQRTGRPAYMAPELIRTNRFNERTDLYAFGVSLYEVATGRKPFHVTEDTSHSLMAMLNEEPPKPRKIRPSLSPRLEAVILRAMHPRPVKRYKSAADIVSDLSGLTEDALGE